MTEERGINGGIMDKISTNLKSKMSNQLRTQRTSGFTLIEILVSIIILSVGILAVSQMTIMGMRVTTVTNQRMYGRTVMAQVFEDLYNLPSNAPELQDPDGPGDLDDDSLGDHSKTMKDPTGQRSYNVVWNVADNTPEPAFKTVRIHVLWGVKENWKITSDLLKRM
jgi:prepilin-type N-terminal cleavage/methylation domain-containing protein